MAQALSKDMKQQMRDGYIKMELSVLALDVACPACGAARNHRCRRGSFPWRRLDTPHTERVSRVSLKYQP